jgi:predicted transcriptional regulator
MTDTLPLPQLREQAIALRRAGRSRREIQQILQIRSNGTLNEVLRGEPPPPWTRRPNAKDAIRAKARDLREQGLAYHEIAAELGVSKSSVSLWVRDLPRPEHLSYEISRERQAAGVARYWARERREREAMRAAVSATAARQIGSLTQREILVAGAIAYWCEGAKNKPHRRTDRVDFINSDPMMIRFFLRFLDTAGISRDRLIFRVSIHESGDVPGAQRFWLDVTQADPAQFRQPQLKRHNPRTTRKNTGEAYRGCLRVEVRRSMELYRKIEGWALGAMSEPPAADGAGRHSNREE